MRSIGDWLIKGLQQTCAGETNSPQGDSGGGRRGQVGDHANSEADSDHLKSALAGFFRIRRFLGRHIGDGRGRDWRWPHDADRPPERARRSQRRKRNRCARLPTGHGTETQRRRKAPSRTPNRKARQITEMLRRSARTLAAPTIYKKTRWSDSLVASRGYSRSSTWTGTINRSNYNRFTSDRRLLTQTLRTEDDHVSLSRSIAVGVHLPLAKRWLPWAQLSPSTRNVATAFFWPILAYPEHIFLYIDPSQRKRGDTPTRPAHCPNASAIENWNKSGSEWRRAQFPLWRLFNIDIYI